MKKGLPIDCEVGNIVEFFHRGDWCEGILLSVDEENTEIFISYKGEEYQIGLEDFPKALKFHKRENIVSNPEKE